MVWHYSGLFYFVLLLLTLFGFVMSIPKKNENKRTEKNDVIPSTITRPPEPVEVNLKEKLSKPETEYE